MNGSEIDYFFLFLRDDWFSLLSIHLGGRPERREEQGAWVYILSKAGMGWGSRER